MPACGSRTVLFVREPKSPRAKVQAKSVQAKSARAIKQLYELGFKRLFEKLEEKVNVFDPQFVRLDSIFRDTGIDPGPDEAAAIPRGQSNPREELQRSDPSGPEASPRPDSLSLAFSR